MTDRAFRCWLPDQPDLGKCWTLASSADAARYAVARSAHDAGYLNRPSPVMVRCVRAPEHDRNPSLEVGRCSTLDHVRLGAAAVAPGPDPERRGPDPLSAHRSVDHRSSPMTFSETEKPRPLPPPHDPFDDPLR